MNQPAEHSLDEGELIVSDSIRIPLDEFQFTYVRSSGPGGQNVNKVSTKAQMRWAVQNSPNLPEDVRQRFLERYARRITTEGELLMTSQRFRDQRRNAADCLEKLRELIEAVATVPKPRKKTKPSRGAKERRLKQKRDQSQRKQLRRRPKLDE